jgi:IclR family KDG regulon transcriptional repressor
LTSQAEQRPKYRIELVEKTFAILEAFSRERTELTLKEIVHATGQTSSGAYRILTNLVRLEVVQHAEGGRYRVAPKLFRIGSLAISDIRRVALPWMAQTRDRLDYTTNLIVLEGGEAVLVEFLQSVRPFTMADTLGSRDPLHCTAAGKCLLAFMEEERRSEVVRGLELRAYTPSTLRTRQALQAELREIRAQVYAVDRGEYEYHARCVAVPLFDRTERVAGALSVTGPESLLIAAEMRQVVVSLQDAGAGLSADLGYLAPYPTGYLSAGEMS